MAQEQETWAARYLHESNLCRPINRRAKFVDLYEGDTFPLDAAAPIAATSNGAGRRWLCSVGFCRKSVGQRIAGLLDALLRRSRLLLALVLMLGDKIQRLIPVLPWSVVRSIVGAMGRCDALRSMRYFRPLVTKGEHNPLLEIQVVPLLSEDECTLLIQDAEAYGSGSGWTTSRHQTHATTDIPVHLLPEAGVLWNTTLAPRVIEAMAQRYGLGRQSITPVDVFVVKYEFQEGGQRELSVHRDGALMTFSLLLNDPADFQGGGTYFEECGRVYRPAQGVAVIHSGKVRHGGFPISSGKRYVLVGFCLVDDPKVSPELKDWRWGEPAWYLSSAVVRDAEVLDRIYNPVGVLARGASTNGASVVHPNGQAGQAGTSPDLGQDSSLQDQAAGRAAGAPGVGGGAVDASGARFNDENLPEMNVDRQSSSHVVEGTPGAENPKYRSDAISRWQLAVSRKAQARDGAGRRGAGGHAWNTAAGSEIGGIHFASTPVEEGVRVDMCANMDEGHVTSLLIDVESESVIGHVVSNDGGLSDAQLDRTLSRLFPPDATRIGGGDFKAALKRLRSAPTRAVRRVATMLGGSGSWNGGGRGGGGGGGSRVVALVSIVVDRHARQQGLGRKLMAATMAFYRQVGFDYVLLQQRDTGSGGLIRFYEDFGFKAAYEFLELAMLAPTAPASTRLLSLAQPALWTSSTHSVAGTSPRAQ